MKLNVKFEEEKKAFISINYETDKGLTIDDGEVVVGPFSDDTVTFLIDTLKIVEPYLLLR